MTYCALCTVLRSAWVSTSMALVSVVESDCGSTTLNVTVTSVSDVIGSLCNPLCHLGAATDCIAELKDDCDAAQVGGACGID